MRVETSPPLLLGFEPNKLHGCYIQILFGPETDTYLLLNAIQNIQQGMPSEFHIALYDQKSRPILMKAQSNSFLCKSTGFRCCLLTLNLAEHACTDRKESRDLTQLPLLKHQETDLYSNHTILTSHLFGNAPASTFQQSDLLVRKSSCTPAGHSNENANTTFSPSKRLKTREHKISLIAQVKPKRGRSSAAAPVIIDEGYVRRLQRRYRLMGRRQSLACEISPVQYSSPFTSPLTSTFASAQAPAIAGPAATAPVGNNDDPYVTPLSYKSATGDWDDDWPTRTSSDPRSKSGQPTADGAVGDVAWLNFLRADAFTDDSDDPAGPGGGGGGGGGGDWSGFGGGGGRWPHWGNLDSLANYGPA